MKCPVGPLQTQPIPRACRPAHSRRSPAPAGSV